jgi:hypothetical protein
VRACVRVCVRVMSPSKHRAEQAVQLTLVCAPSASQLATLWGRLLMVFLAELEHCLGSVGTDASATCDVWWHFQNCQ